jgi:predicted transposase/invertase (TIGR01784 family)
LWSGSPLEAGRAFFTVKDAVCKGRYAYLLFDATFKVVVCTPENEKLLIELIELLIPEKHISSIEFINKEQHGLVVEEKNVTFDMLCLDKDTGERFLVEVQNREKDSFLDRMLSYSTYPIREQLAVKLKKMREKKYDHMDYSLNPVYVISMIDFSLPHESDKALEQEYISRYEIRNGRNGEILTRSLNFVFLEMGRLELEPGEPNKCKNLLEKFIFSMKNMHMLTERPESFDDPLLVDLFNATELASMSVQKRQNYDRELLQELDKMCEISFARREGKTEAMLEARADKEQTVRNMLADGMSPELVAKYTSLSLEEIASIKAKTS